MLQGCLFLTTAHLNRFWRLSLEILVLVHGTAVALTQGEGFWSMFFFGFAGIFIITQMHGLRSPIADYLDVLILAELIGLWLRLRPRAYAAE